MAKDPQTDAAQKFRLPTGAPHLLEAALQAAANGIVITDPSATILWANRAMTALTGYTPGELVGQSTKIFKSGEHAESFYENLWAAIRSGHVWTGEMVNRRKDGSLYTEEMTITPVRDGQGGISYFIAIKQDISARKRAESRLLESEQQLRLFVEHSPAAIAMLDHDMRYVIASHRWLKDYRLQDQNIVGRSHYEVFPEVSEQWKEIHKRCLAGAAEKCEEDRFPRADGTTDWIRWEIHPWHTVQGNVGGLIILSEVITERRQMQKQIATLQKFEAIGQLAGGIAHDFNNVLGTILGWAEMGMEEAPVESRPQNQFRKIRDQANRAAGLTHQLLAFARRQVLEPHNLNLNQAVSETTDFLHKTIPANVEVKLQLAADLATVHADLAQMEQVLMNLCLNARDAMATQARGRLLIETQNVSVDESYSQFHIYAKPGPYVLLTVSDTGVGMDAATQERIFEPFFTTKEMGKGTGLGLATVYGIVKQHGGFVNVYSEPGQGSTFKVYLPAIRAAAEAIQPEEKEDVRGGTETILVAEDHEAGREMVFEILQKLGYTVLLAANGEDAARIFEAHQERIDLLLFDVVMPKLNGPDAFQRIRTLRPDIPAIFATGYSSEAELLNSLTGANCHLLQKPYSSKALARKIRELLDRQSPPSD